LNRVLGFVIGSQTATRHREQHAVMTLNEAPDRRLVIFPGGGNEFVIGGVEEFWTLIAPHDQFRYVGDQLDARAS